MTVHVSVATAEEIPACLDIRRIVFVVGQGVPENVDFDGSDAASRHYLVRLDDLPVGTARVRFLKNVAKIERVAILPSHQRTGLGTALMLFVLEDIRSAGIVKKAMLGAQLNALDFYKALGFETTGPEYLDAAIWHRNMKICP